MDGMLCSMLYQGVTSLVVSCGFSLLFLWLLLMFLIYQLASK